MYFTFGVLTVFAMIAIGILIYSIKKIFKTEKQIKYIQEDLQNIIRNSHQEMKWYQDDINDRFRDVYQELNQRRNSDSKKLLKG